MKKYIDDASIIGMFLVEYLILGPLEIWNANSSELIFNWGDFLGVFFLLSMLMLIIYVVCVQYMPPIMHEWLNAGLFAIGFATYIQVLFLNGMLITEHGNNKVWSETDEIINAIIWFFIVMLCVFSYIFDVRKKTKNACLLVCKMIVGVQFIATIFIIFSHISQVKPVKTTQTIDFTQQFEVACDKNIILIIIDTFGNEIFDRECIDDPYWTILLKDFTYYSNANSVYDCTFPSMVHLLSGGVEIKSAEKMDAYFTRAWDDLHSLKDEFSQKEYECRIYSGEDFRVTLGTPENIKSFFDNVKNVPVKVDRNYLLYVMTKYSLYRSLPFALKPFFEQPNDEFSYIYKLDTNNEFNYSNYRFYNKLKTNGLKINEEINNLLLINHIVGVHDNASTSIYYDKTSVSLDERIDGMYAILDEYFSELKRVGKYNDSDIIIMSDHGSGVENGYADYQPLLLIKLSGENNSAMFIDEDYVSYADLLYYIYNNMVKNERDVPFVSDVNKSVFLKRCGNKVGQQQIYNFEGYCYEGTRDSLNHSIDEGSTFEISNIISVQ